MIGSDNMTIEDLFSESMVNFNLKADTKVEIIDELINILFKAGKIKNRDEFRIVVIEREKQFSTGIGMGIAIPHGKGAMVKEPSIAFALTEKPVDFESIDGEPVRLCFLIAVPNENSDIHLKAISQISRRLIHKEVRDKLLTCSKYEEFIDIVTGN